MKNKFLLLSGVATIAVASVALAEDPAPVTAATYSNRATAKLNTQIYIFSPITMTDGYLAFPSITTTNMNGSAPIKVKVNPDGTIDYGESTAQIVDDDDADVGPITITGGTIGNYKSTYTAAGDDAAALAALDTQYSDEFSFGDIHEVALSATIPLYVEGNTANAKCGEVGALTPEWHYTNYTNNGKGALELSIGGTFTLENGFEATNGYAYCKGSTTVTYIMDI